MCSAITNSPPLDVTCDENIDGFYVALVARVLAAKVLQSRSVDNDRHLSIDNVRVCVYSETLMAACETGDIDSVIDSVEGGASVNVTEWQWGFTRMLTISACFLIT